ncbi:MAG TPA: phenylphosphate carboxylase subunit delta [Burkholderiales bacterium]
MDMNEALERARGIKFMAFDVDGILTDGTLYLSDSGEEIKGFNTLDGLGLKLLQDNGVELAIITGRESRLVALRAQQLGIRRLHQGIEHKFDIFDALRRELGLELNQCGYMGDDLPDLGILSRCGFAATVPQAPMAVRSRVHYVTETPAGDGAAREVCDLILQSQGKLDRAIARFLA